jgi:hypothetical protein
VILQSPSKWKAENQDFPFSWGEITMIGVFCAALPGPGFLMPSQAGVDYSACGNIGVVPTPDIE